MTAYTQPPLDLAPTWASLLRDLHRQGLRLTRNPMSWRSTMADWSASYGDTLRLPDGSYVWVHVLRYGPGSVLAIRWQVTAYLMVYIGHDGDRPRYSRGPQVVLDDPTPAKILDAARLVGLTGGTS